MYFNIFEVVNHSEHIFWFFFLEIFVTRIKDIYLLWGIVVLIIKQNKKMNMWKKKIIKNTALQIYYSQIKTHKAPIEAKEVL